MKDRTLTDDQHAWYSSQPPSYRSGWWWWAIGQPNFAHMLKVFVEEDERVLAVRDNAVRTSRE